MIFARGDTPYDLEPDIYLLFAEEEKVLGELLKDPKTCRIHRDLLLYEPRCAVCLRRVEDDGTRTCHCTVDGQPARSFEFAMFDLVALMQRLHRAPGFSASVKFDPQVHRRERNEDDNNAPYITQAADNPSNLVR